MGTIPNGWFIMENPGVPWGTPISGNPHVFGPQMLEDLIDMEQHCDQGTSDLDLRPGQFEGREVPAGHRSTPMQAAKRFGIHGTLFDFD